MQVSTLSSPIPPSSASDSEVVRAAKSFEAILLQSLLDSLEKSFATMPGQKSDQSSDNYRYLGAQALCSELADAGGFGIARMIARNLLKTKDKSAVSRGQTE